MMNKLKPTIVLTSICLIVALLLSVVNMFTAPIIADRANAAANEALLEVLPTGTDFEKLESLDGLPEAVTDAWKAPEGYVFRTEVSGYASGMVVMVGIDSVGKITGTKCLSSNETYGFENKLDGQYNDKTLDSLELIIATGASPNSMTSKGYYSAVQASLQAFAILGGEDVDLRTPEEILQDDCNAALGTEGKTFTKWFATEILTGVDAVYESEDGKVFKLGDMLIGFKNGAVVGEATDEEKATVEAAYALVDGSTATEIEKPDTITSKYVSKIYVTESGNYVFDLVADGYQALFEYGNGEKIYITVSISADGKIIDCLTTKHSESKGYGDVCATEDYLNGYKGAGDEDVTVAVGVPDYTLDQIPADNTDIGVIASATYTTYGYQRAIKAAFAAYEILKGEA